MLRDCINDCFLKGQFPDSLKLGNITPVQKKDESTDKENYRLIYYQLNQYLEQHLNSLLCGFRKAHSTQHVLFPLIML